MLELRADILYSHTANYLHMLIVVSDASFTGVVLGIAPWNGQPTHCYILIILIIESQHR